MPENAADAAAPAAAAVGQGAAATAVAAGGSVPFPASVRTLAVGPAEFAAGGSHALRVALYNSHDRAVMHVRFAPAAEPWVAVFPAEVALGPEERQNILLQVDVDRAKAALKTGAAPVATLPVSYQRLFPAGKRDATEAAAPAQGSGAIYLRLPLATCPSCDRIVDEDVRDGIPDVCPYCFERLRACPVCGAPNSWLARRCVLDATHVIRAAPDWPELGGGAGHTGSRDGARVPALLSRRWSFPNVAPARRENALLWSAPVAAYGLVAATAATQEGESELFAFDAVTGAPLWDAYPLADPVYPERGGAAIAGGRIFAATVEGAMVCVDALRGTRIWESALGARVYGSIVPVGDDRLLIPAATSERVGCLFIVAADDGRILHKIALSGPPDSAPASENGIAYVHDDSGTLTSIDIVTGAVRWFRSCGAGFDAAPVVREGLVFSATSAGEAICHDAATGEEKWRLAVTNAPFSGTPACDGALLYLPADDGVHLLSAPGGRAVRRYPLRRPVRSAPVVIGGTLFFGGTDGNIYAIEPGRSLETAYQTGLAGSQIIAAPAVADGALFLTATNGVLYALNIGGQDAH